MSKKRPLSPPIPGEGKRARAFSYVYVDQHHPATESLLAQIAKSEPDIQLAYRDYLQETSLMVEPNAANFFVIVDESAQVVVGYVLGSTSTFGLHIGNVFITEGMRGLGMCVPLMVAYLNQVQQVSPVDNIDLYNAGGERSCRCYTKAFEQTGYVQKRPMDCSNPRKVEATMRAAKVPLTAGYYGLIFVDQR
jgi:hypothetical protein